MFCKVNRFYLNFRVRHGMRTFENLFHCKTLYKEQSGSRSSKFVKQNMEDENVLQLIINSENLSITVDSDSEKWSFNLYSCGYHEYTNIWAPLIGDESLICQKKDMCMILMLWSLFEERLSSKMSPKYMCPLLEIFYVFLTHQYVLEYWVKWSTALLGMVSKFLSAMLSKVM